jgi:hypothetical protein
MARVLVVDDNGTVTWNERITTEDLETEHFRRCLSDRLSWAVADAYVQHRAASFRRLPEARQRLERHAKHRQPLPRSVRTWPVGPTGQAAETEGVTCGSEILPHEAACSAAPSDARR